MDQYTKELIKIWTTIGVIIVVIILGLMLGIPHYNLWQREMAGRAELAEAEWTKKVAIEEAKAKQDSAQYEAEAEIIRARGVSESNRIVAEGLGGPEGYLRYLYINALTELEGGQIIYVPTEAGIPVLEAGRAIK